MDVRALSILCIFMARISSKVCAWMVLLKLFKKFSNGSLRLWVNQNTNHLIVEDLEEAQNLLLVVENVHVHHVTVVCARIILLPGASRTVGLQGITEVPRISSDDHIERLL